MKKTLIILMIIPFLLCGCKKRVDTFKFDGTVVGVANCSLASASISEFDIGYVVSLTVPDSIGGVFTDPSGKKYSNCVVIYRTRARYYVEDRIKGMAFYGNMVLALTDSGRLLYDITNNQLMGVVNAKDRFTMIDSNEAGVVAVSLDGSIYFSQDGKNYSTVYESYLPSMENNVCGIGSSGTTTSVCYKNGTIITIAKMSCTARVERNISLTPA